MSKKIFLVFFLLLFLFACGTKSVYVQVLRPAEINLKNYKKIAVGEIQNINGRSGGHADDISDEINTALFNSGRFEVIDRQHLKSVQSEHKLGFSGAVDEATSVRLGKLVGAGVFVFGRIQSDKYEEELTKGEPWTDKEGKTNQRFSRKGVYNLSVNFKVIDIETSKIIAVKTISAKKEDLETTYNGIPKKIDSNKLYRKCLNQVVSGFMKLIAPYKETVEAEFQTDELLPEVDQAVAFFEVNEWTRGINLLDSAREKTGLKSNVLAKIYYNLGVALMITGDYDKSSENFLKAMQLNPEDSTYKKSVRRVKEEKNKAERLRQQI